jgi:hypothetical protein
MYLYLILILYFNYFNNFILIYIIIILIVNCLTNSCIRNTCVTWQGIGYKLSEDDTIVSKHVGVR